MRVVHTAAELKNQASGPSHSIPHFLQGLREAGVDVSLEALQPEPERQLDFPQTYHPKWRFARPLGISPSLRRALHQAAREADVVHTHNLWMMPNIYPYRAARRHGARLVVTPRGTLKEWAFRYRRRRKRLVWITMQRRVVMEADLIHATSEDEIADLRRLGVRAPVAHIPNGVVIPELRQRSTAEERTLLFLGRIHPVKGLDLLLRAWKELAARHPGWHLQVVGPDPMGHLEEIRALAERLELDRCHFRGPVFGEDKEQTYRRADLFVLPSKSENFGMAVAEALASGLPSVVTRGAPWAGLQQHDCGRWVRGDVASLTQGLDELMGFSDARRGQMGLRGRRWMKDEFSWQSIAEQMKFTYAWLLGQEERPSWVYLD